jgi:hypothetical protein
MMAEPIGFKVRLRIRMGKPFTTDEKALSVKVGGRQVTIRSQNLDEPLRETRWVVLGARGFTTEDEARAFGEELRVISQVAALSCRLGTDTGQDRPTGMVNEQFARSCGWIQPHERIMPNVHGIQVLPDDDHTRIPIINARAEVTADPNQFVSAIAELSHQLPIRLSASALSVRLLNFAIMNSEPVGRMVLAFSAVELLGQEETWTDQQRALLQAMADNLEGDDPTPQRTEIATALRRSMHRVGLRQGVMRVLSRLKLDKLKKEWDRLYGLRSGLIHGTEPLSEGQISQLADDTVKLCGRIVLAMVEKDGISLAPVVRWHSWGE